MLSFEFLVDDVHRSCYPDLRIRKLAQLIRVVAVLKLIGEFLERFVQQLELVVWVGIRGALAETGIKVCLLNGISYLLVSLWEIRAGGVEVPCAFKKCVKDGGGI